MKASEAKIKIQIMHDWLMTPVGRYMLEWEENLFQTLSADIFGFNALQIGFSEINALKRQPDQKPVGQQPVLSGTTFLKRD